jgi:quercetin dioxygenase-like cupin family protein
MEQNYAGFIETEGVPITRSLAINDLEAIAVEPWERTGGLGAYVLLDGRGHADSFVTEILPGGELKDQRHLYEESVFVVSGSGRTELWNDSGHSASFNWETGAVFAIPLNVHYKHINRDSNAPARLYSITNQPLMIDLFRDPEFIYGCDQDFQTRFNPTITDFAKPAQPGGYTDDPKAVSTGLPFEGNLVPSAYDVDLPPAPYRGANGGLLSLELANSSIGSHISEFPSRTYKKAHRHGAGAHVILLKGTGYSLLWKGDEEPVKVDWQRGTVIVPPENVFHQHFNTGETPARYLALRFSGRKSPFPNGATPAQIEYEDENPKIKKLFEAEISR